MRIMLCVMLDDLTLNCASFIRKTRLQDFLGGEEGGLGDFFQSKWRYKIVTLVGIPSYLYTCTHIFIYVCKCLYTVLFK